MSRRDVNKPQNQWVYRGACGCSRNIGHGVSKGGFEMETLLRKESHGDLSWSLSDRALVLT